MFRMFRALGQIVSRHPVWFLVLWPVLGLGLIWLSPNLQNVTSEGAGTQLPPQYESSRAAEKLAVDFHGYERDNSTLVVLLNRSGGLEPADDDQIKFITKWLREQTYQQRVDDKEAEAPLVHQDILGKLDQPYLSSRLVSTDRSTTMIAARLKTSFLAEDSQNLVSRLVKELDARLAGTGLSFSLTGSAAVGRDYGSAIGQSLDRTEIVTYIMVVVILILIYRSPVAALVPLVTILLSLKIAEAVVAQFAQHLVPIPSLVPVFMVVVMFGAGTNYCLFLVGRYKEELGRGATYKDAARTAVTYVGRAIGASAGTEILGLCLMGFASFKIFNRTGVCVGLSLIPALGAALTLAPAIFLVLGKKAFWPGRADVPLTGRLAARLWRRVAMVVCRRPKTVLITATILSVPFIYLGLTVQPSYDLFAELPQDSLSVKGQSLLLEKFSYQSRPEQLTAVIDTQTPLMSKEGQQALLKLVREIGKLPDVVEVRSLVTPTGQENAVLDRYLEGGGQEPSVPVPPTGTETLPWWQRLLPTPQLAQFILKEAATTYLGKDEKGHVNDLVTKVDIVLMDNPFSRRSVNLVDPMRLELRHLVARSGLRDAQVLVGGLSAYMDDLRHVTLSDLHRLMILVSAMVYILLVWLMGDWFSPLYMLGTMVVSYLATLGVADLVFRYLVGGPGLDWKIQFFLFVLLVAIGEDYNIYLMSRVREETARRGMREGVRRAIVFTGSIISSCGIIMAGTFGSLMSARVGVMVQIGFAMAFGILLDTFVIRPVVLPSIALVFRRLHAWHLAVPEDGEESPGEELPDAPNGDDAPPHSET